VGFFLVSCRDIIAKLPWPLEREREALEEDDLDLLEENTGGSFKKPRLTRLRRGRDDSPPSTSRRRNAIESSDEDLDNDDLELPPTENQDIQRIFDDAQDDDDGDLDDMHDFIDYGDDEDGEGTGQMDEQEKEQRRRERRKAETARRRLLGQRPDLIGMDEKYVSIFLTPHFLGYR
jgi:transcription elongation factor SPT6